MLANNSSLPDANTALTRFLGKRFAEFKGDKTQRQIAAAAGYDKPNILSMFKRGDTKIPIDKVPALAKALEVDVAHLFRLVVETHWPTVLPVIEEIFGGQLASKNEVAIFLTKWRATTADTDP